MDARLELKEFLTGFGPETLEEIDKTIEELAERVFEKQVQFLFGAGMSRGSGYQVFSEFVQDLLPRFFSKQNRPTQTVLDALGSKYPPEALVAAFVQDHDEASLRELLAENFDRRDCQPHAGHQALGWLINQKYVSKVYTTNFDTLIEDELGTGRGVTVTESNVDLLDHIIDRGQFPVLHLHGTTTDKHRITEAQTYSLESSLGIMLKADMMRYRIFAVGYSMGDMDLRAMHFSLRELLNRDHMVKQSYVALKLSTEDPRSEWNVARKVWLARGWKPIPLSAENVLIYLQEKVRSLEFGGMRSKLEKKTDPKLLDNRIRKIMELTGGTEEDAIRSIAAETGDGDSK